MSQWAQRSHAKLEIDKSKRIALMKELKQLHAERITAGIHKAEGRKAVSASGFKMIDVAVQNEYGNTFTMPRTVRFKKNGQWFVIKQGTTIKIPETRFVSRLVQHPSELEFLKTMVRAELHLVVKGYQTATAAVRNIGQFMRDRIRSYITNKEFEPNAPMTVAAKGFDQRLFEKGQLLHSIKYKTKRTKQNG